jgi:hypothetical protein
LPEPELPEVKAGPSTHSPEEPLGTTLPSRTSNSGR